MGTRYIWLAHKSVPHLHVTQGDYLIFDPAGPAVFMVQRQVPHPDFGALMAAEEAGDLELVSFRPSGRAPLSLVSSESRPSPARQPPPPGERVPEPPEAA